MRRLPRSRSRRSGSPLVATPAGAFAAGSRPAAPPAATSRPSGPRPLARAAADRQPLRQAGPADPPLHVPQRVRRRRGGAARLARAHPRAQPRAARRGRLPRRGGRRRRHLGRAAARAQALGARAAFRAPRRAARSRSCARTARARPPRGGPLTVEPQPAEVPAGMIDAEVQGHKVFFGARRPAELSYVRRRHRAGRRAGRARPAADGAIVRAVVAGRGRARRRRRRCAGTARSPAGPARRALPVPRHRDRRVRRARDVERCRARRSARGARARASDAARRPTARQARSSSCATASRSSARTTTARAAARFGGGRGHQGQDVFAACGTPIVAARGGVVKFKEYQAAAGNYVVIDGARTGTRLRLHAPARGGAGRRGRPRQDRPADRLRRRHRPRRAAATCTSRSGRAPGWYSGGSAFDPLPDLRGLGRAVLARGRGGVASAPCS